MKNILTILFLVVICLANAQVIIGDKLGTAGVKTSVLLEFAHIPGQNKGIIVPYVRTLPATLPTRIEGAILLDASNPTKARMKFYNANTTPLSNGWFDLSGQDGNVTSALTDQPTVVQAPEIATSKAIIGSTSSSADGVLVLESTTKAMVLPQVDKVSDIPSPSPGMMVYVNKTGAKRLAVFNGTKWSFWKP